MFLLVVNVILLIAGNVMEPSSILLIMAPILFPVAVKLGIDPVHFGIIMVVNMEIGMNTPPVGLNLYVASHLSHMRLTDVSKAALPFVGTQFMTAPWGEIALQSVTQGLLSGLVATVLYGAAVRALGGTQAAAYTAITPVAAAIGGAALLSEPLGISTVIAALVTGLGVLLSTGLLSGRAASG